MSEEIFEQCLAPYASFRAFFHGHTYTGNALACAVAIASLDVFARDRVIARVGDRAAQLGRMLDDDIGTLDHVGEIRRWGLMNGIEIVSDRD